MKSNANNAARLESSTHAVDPAERVRVNQAKLTSQLRSHYDFIVCGAGSTSPIMAQPLSRGRDIPRLRRRRCEGEEI
jgi:hypothetical protein